METEQAEDQENKHRDLKEFCADGNGALAKAVGEEPAGHGEKDKRDGEKSADEENQSVFTLRTKVKRKNQVDDKVLEAVLAEGSLKLCGDEAPEAKAPVL